MAFSKVKTAFVCNYQSKIQKKKIVYRSTENFDWKDESFHKTNFCRKVNKNSTSLRFHAKNYAKWWKRGFSNSYLLKLKQVRHQLKFLSLLRSLVPANGWEPISFKHPRKSQKILNLEYFPIQKPFLINNS